jgi:CHAT domain-containing protein
MKAPRNFIAVFLASFLGGCASDLGGTVSISEANHLALEFSRQKYTPPDRSTDDIREAYKDYLPDDKHCIKFKQGRLTKRNYILNRVSTGGSAITVSNFAADMSYLAETEFSHGNFKEALEFSKRAYRVLPSSGQRVRQAVLASSIGRMHARLGNNSAASNWFSKAKRHWKMAGPYTGTKWSATSKGLANVYSVKAAKAYIDNDLLAEEYFLREGLPHIWQGRNSKWFSVNSEYTVARLTRNLILQGRPIEAEMIARKYLEIRYFNFSRAFNKPLIMHAIAEAIYSQNRLEEAEYIARLALTIHQNICSLQDGIPLTEVRQTLIKILSNEGKWQKLQELESEIKKALLDKPSRYQQLYGSNPDLLLAHIFSGDSSPGLIDKVLTARSLAVKEHGSKSIEALELDAVLGIVYELVGEHDKALDSYHRSVPVLLQQASKNTGQSKLYHRFRDYYLQFLTSNAGAKAARGRSVDPVAVSFNLANSYNLGNVQRQLSVSALKASVNDPDLTKAIRDLQNIEYQGKNMLDLIVFLQTGQEGQVDYGRIKELNEKHSILRSAKIQLEDQISNDFPAYSQLLNPRTPEISELKLALNPNEVLLVYHSDKEQTYLWSLHRDGDLALDTIGLNKIDLKHNVDALRESLDPNTDTLDGIPQYDIKLAHELYQKLLGPVLDRSPDHLTELVVVSGKELGTLPLGLLVTEKSTVSQSDNSQTSLQSITGSGLKKDNSVTPIIQNELSGSHILFSEYRNIPWLINEYSVSVVPSASSLVLLRQIEQEKGQSRIQYAGYGAPLFQAGEVVEQDYQSRGLLALNRRSVPDTRAEQSADLSLLPPLPDTKEEVEEIGRLLNADPQYIFVGKRATEQNVKQTNLKDKQVLVFATHGLLPGDLNGLDQPALAMTNPQLLDTDETTDSALENKQKEDGLLTMQEIIGIKLNADWVILSACNTGAANGEGAEAFSGLGQAFFYAGAKSLLLTNWPVESASARLLTTGIFKELKQNSKLTRAQALQQSIKTLISSNDASNSYSYAHPIFWAPFTLVGDGG